MTTAKAMDKSMLHRKILHGDVLEKLGEIPDCSIDCIITSPPYWGLRDYGVIGQIGLEPDYRLFLKTMRKIMDELKRVLKDTGTCWINFSDTYNNTKTGNTHGIGKHNLFVKPGLNSQKFKKTKDISIQVKSLIGIPERFYTQCIDDDWIARNDIPWIKINHMPSSKTDAFSNKHEHVYFFAKTAQANFYYHRVTGEAVGRLPTTMEFGKDYEMVTCLNKSPDKIKPCTSKHCKLCTGTGKKKRSFWHSVNYYFDLDPVRVETMVDTHTPKKIKEDNTLQCDLEGNVIIPTDKTRNTNKQDNVLGADGKPKQNYKGFNERWKKKQKFEDGKWRDHYDDDGNCLGCGKHWTKHTVSKRAKGSMHGASKRAEDVLWCNTKGKNPGDVFYADYSDEELLEWIKLCREEQKAFDVAPPDLFFINPKPFPEAHFATFPVELPLKILKCSCPQQVCTKCGKPRHPIQRTKEKTSYTKCNCNETFRPGIVLDPFFGAGTTAVAAEKLGLQWIGIELNQEYIDIAKKRLEKFYNDKLEEFC